MRGAQVVTDSERARNLGDLADQQRVAQRLAHLLAADGHPGVVQPVVREAETCRAGLGLLVLMVGEAQVDASAMNVEGVEQEPLSFRASFSGVSNYVLAVASDAMVLAYNTDTNMSDGISAANILNFDDETDTFVLPLADKSESPYELQLSYDGSYLLMVGRRSKIVNNVLNSREVMSFVRTDQVSTETNLLNGEHTVVGAAFAPDSNAIAYITRDEENPETQGLYIASAPGEEGQLVLEGMFISPVNASYLFYWAEGGIILLSDFEVNELVTVKVEKAGAVSGA